MHTTTRLGIDVVDGGDAVSNYPAANAQAMGVLDNAAIVLSGTLVSRPAASIQGRYYLATDDTSSGSSIGTLYFDTGAAWVSGFNPPSRGATNIATSQSTSSTTYTTLATPDQVAGIVLPTNGLISVAYQATWQESFAGAASAAIFIGSNQAEIQGFDSTTHGPLTQSANTVGLTAGNNRPLFSWPGGLASGGSNASYGADITTGQILGYFNVSAGVGVQIGAASPLVVSFNGAGGAGLLGGPCSIFAAAGTYTVSVQFKASSGSVTALNRKLWVQTISFT